MRTLSLLSEPLLGVSRPEFPSGPLGHREPQHPARRCVPDQAETGRRPWESQPVTVSKAASAQEQLGPSLVSGLVRALGAAAPGRPTVLTEPP